MKIVILWEEEDGFMYAHIEGSCHLRCEGAKGTVRKRRSANSPHC